MKKTIFIYPIIFISTVLVCLLFLLATTLIPQGAVRENVKAGAGYFYETPLFENTVDNLENFKKDNYADCITTGIAWHLGEGESLGAVIATNYNRMPDENVNESFYRQMQGENVNTESYSRYWHGSAGIIRLLFLFADIEGIRYGIAVIGLILNVVMVISLIRKKQVALSIAYTIAFLLVNGVFALTCLEYAFIFLLVPLVTVFLIANKRMKEERNVAAMFLVTGMLTAFFDFLTAETLTFTVPFVIYFITVRSEEMEKETKTAQRRKDWLFLFKSGICWCAGYAGMFLAKWGLSALVLGKDTFLASADLALERINGDVSLTLSSTGPKADLWQRLAGIFQRNLGCLYWSPQDVKISTVILITLIIVSVSGIFWYMMRKEKYEYDRVALFTVVALVPYLRFLVVSNHAYIHYFFTYRAQLVTVMVLLYLLYDTTVLSKKGKR